MHAHGKISGACFFCGNFFATRCHLMLQKHAYIRGHPTRSHAPEGFRRRNRAARKPDPAARPIRATPVAFGLPQDASLQLMFEPCVNRRSSLSAFRDVGFHVERAAFCSARRLRMRRKRLSKRPNFCARAAVARATPLKRFHRHGFPDQTTRCEALKARRLPQVRRNVPSSRRKTPLVRASFSHRLAMRLKRFNARRFSSRSDRAITILPQAAIWFVARFWIASLRSQ
jgi:hypothetical protein